MSAAPGKRSAFDRLLGDASERPLTRQQRRGLRHFAAGTPFHRAEDDPPFRNQAGEWLADMRVPLSFDMEEQVREAARRQGVDPGQVIRTALVAAGFGTPADVVAARDGTTVYHHMADAEIRYGTRPLP